MDHRAAHRNDECGLWRTAADIIVNDVPLVLREDIYALAALAGAAAYVGGMTLGFNASLVTLGSALLALVLRGCAIQFKWSLPAIKLSD